MKHRKAPHKRKLRWKKRQVYSPEQRRGRIGRYRFSDRRRAASV